MKNLPASPGRAALALAVLSLAALAAVNVRDEELRPEARALFERASATFSRDSGWALIVGLHAPAGQDPRDFAEKLRRRSASGQQSAPGGLLELRGAAELLCDPELADCLRTFAQRPDSVSILAEDNALLLSRYDELLRSSRLADVTTALDYYGLITFGPVLNAQRVRLAQASAAAAGRRVDAAVALLEADAAFYRRWLEEADSILTKMLAVRGFTRDLLVAGQVARAGVVLQPAQWDALERVAAPLTPVQSGLLRPMRREAALFAQLIDKLVAAPRETGKVIDAPPLMADLAGHTLRRNATLNFAYPIFEPWTRLDGVDGPGLAAAIAAVKASVALHLERGPTWLYNYTGRSLAADGAPDFDNYVYRARDADALAATVRCVIALRRAAVPEASAGDFVAAAPACRDPYTAKALRWDAKRGELSFQAGWPKNAERLGGANGRVAFAPYPR